MTRILITGGTGYIGSALYRHLTAAGHEVDTIDLEWRGNNINPRNRKRDYRDVLEFSADLVIHLAGHSGVAACVENPLGSLKNNLTGLIDLATDLGEIPLIYASSASVLSPAGGYTNMYDATKRAAEEIIPLVHSNAIGLRFGTVCGASENMRTDLMVNAMVKSAIERGKIVMSNPTVWRPILGMKDLCRAVEAMIDNRPAAGCYNLCSFNAFVADIANTVGEIMSVPVECVVGSQTYDFRMAYDAMCGWTPQQKLGDIVTDVLAQFAKEKELA